MFWQALVKIETKSGFTSTKSKVTSKFTESIYHIVNELRKIKGSKCSCSRATECYENKQTSLWFLRKIQSNALKWEIRKSFGIRDI